MQITYTWERKHNVALIVVFRTATDARISTASVTLRTSSAKQAPKIFQDSGATEPRVMVSGRKIVCRPRLVETILRLPTIPRYSIPRLCRPRRRGNYSANFQPNRSSTGRCGACSCIEMHYRPKLNVKYVPRAQRREWERVSRTQRGRRTSFAFLGAEPKQDLVEAFANLNESCRKKLRFSSSFLFRRLSLAALFVSRLLAARSWEGHRNIFFKSCF